MQADNMPAQAEIEFSEEQGLLALSAADVLGKRHDFAAVRRAMTTASGHEPQLYRELAELGWLGLALPAAYGGAEMPVATLVSLVEPMGRMLFASPFMASTLSAQALLHAGNEGQKQAWLPRIASGEVVAALALTEPDGSFELEHISAQAVESASGYTLSGTKTMVLDAQNADVILLAVRLAGKHALLLAPRAALGDRLRAETLIDETRRSARIRLDGLSVPRSALLDGGDALASLQHTQRVAWLLMAADMAGGAEGVMQLTLEYLKTRKQFGKLIGGYQSLKHPMVEIMCALEQGRSLLYHAVTAFERSDAERDTALRMAKAQLGDTFAHAADRAIQFHGAIGFTYECHAQLFFRHAQWAQYAFGDSAHHRRHLAQLMWPVGA